MWSYLPFTVFFFLYLKYVTFVSCPMYHIIWLKNSRTLTLENIYVKKFVCTNFNIIKDRKPEEKQLPNMVPMGIFGKTIWFDALISHIM